MCSLHAQNQLRMNDIIASVVDGTTTPTAAAATLFHWLDDIVNERCAPYENFGYETAPGDTPRVNEFSTNVGVDIVGYACIRELCGRTFEEWEAHARLADLAREFWRLLGTRKWISRGHPMATSDNWLLDNLCNIFPDPDFYRDLPPAEQKAKRNKDIISYYRILATLDERGGLHWLRPRLARKFDQVQAGAHDDTSFYSLAYIIEILGKTLYNTREDFWVNEFDTNGPHSVAVVREKGYCEVNWQRALAAVTNAAEDQSRDEEVRDAARKTAETMIRIEEEVKQEREARRLEEERKNPRKEKETEPRNGKGEVKFRTYLKNWSTAAPAS
ncbi:hypothetical protein DFP73DRAFT_196787 [Morchella snyderi]|nr:hypothetical protein DFP73DRAFT_196787 [Morchella snyderi]